MAMTLYEKHKLVSSQNPFLSLSETIFQTLATDIIFFQILPGQVLTESKIADELKVSRTAVSSAIERLILSGMVKKEPSHSPVVADFSPKDYHDLWSVRALLEAQAAGQMTQTVTQQDIRIMTETADALADSVRRKAYNDILQNNIAFHTYIVNHSNNMYVRRLYNQLSSRIRQYMLINIIYRTDSTSSFGELHYSLIDAIESKNPEYAHEYIYLHIKRGLYTDEEITNRFNYAAKKLSSHPIDFPYCKTKRTR